jgi:phytoene dehydrogenase-like protein
MFPEKKRMKPQYDTIVVGTGLGGLIAAAEIALAGRHVCCIEAQTKTGGVLSNFKRGPYEFEISLHALDGLDQFDTKLAVF